jgi:hypothetical protein
MVRAILAGQKSQTRRIVKGIPLQPAPRCHPDHKASPDAWDDVRCFGDEWSFRGETALTEHLIRCPYGKPGDRLWVKETVSESEPCYLGGRPQPTVWYRADNNRPTWAERKWTPSIHCARRLSRITLEVTDVRVQRLQDISEEDAMAEGVESREVITGASYEGGGHVEKCGARYLHGTWPCDVFDSSVDAFSDLWQSINGPGSWDANPFVWVVSFKRVEQ